MEESKRSCRFFYSHQVNCLFVLLSLNVWNTRKQKREARVWYFCQAPPFDGFSFLAECIWRLLISALGQAHSVSSSWQMSMTYDCFLWNDCKHAFKKSKIVKKLTQFSPNIPILRNFQKRIGSGFWQRHSQRRIHSQQIFVKRVTLGARAVFHKIETSSQTSPPPREWVGNRRFVKISATKYPTRCSVGRYCR